jgi:hypothetical protein
MHPQRYCVYNQNNECFLSLGATLGDRSIARLKRWFGFRRTHADEGCWIPADGGAGTFGFLVNRDLVFLDSDHRVLFLLEGHPALRALPTYKSAKSVLALPVHTISSSRTQKGNQLVICAAQEMEQRLRELQPEKKPVAAAVAHAVSGSVAGLAAGLSQPRGAERERPTFSVAYYAEGGKLAVHAIRDLCDTGLFLVTHHRWPIGAEVKMSLQPSAPLDPGSAAPMTVCMRVTRWGTDGVALEFAGAAAEMPEAKSRYVC